MKNIFNSLKGILGNEQDPLLGAIKKAMRILAYDYETDNDGKSITCLFPADNALRYKSRLLLRPDEKSIFLCYTIHARRCRHDQPFQDPKSRAALAGYKFRSGAESLDIMQSLPQDAANPQAVAEAIQKIRATALTVYTDAGIPEDPDEAIDFNGVSAKAIKDEMLLYKCFKDVRVSDKRVYSEVQARSANDGTALWGFGIAFCRNGSDGIDCRFYYNTIALPQAPAERLAENFAAAFGLKGRLAYAPAETSFTVTSDTLTKPLVSRYVELLTKAVGNLWDDINQTVDDEHGRLVAERKRQQEAAKAKEREAERERELQKEFTLRLSGDIALRQIQKIFSDGYPFLKLNFYLVKTAQSASRNEYIQSLDPDLALAQIRSFRGECQVSIYGQSTPQDIEKEFRDKSGLVVKVCYENPDGESFYISPRNELHAVCLYDINTRLAELGYKRLA